MPNSLYAGEIVYDDFNSHALRGDGHSIIVGGERRLFSRTRPPMSANPRDFSVKFEDVAETIPRDEWGDRIKEQLEKMARVSDYQDFPPHDQNGLPTCHRDDTEVLTESGFVPWPEYNWSDLLATMNTATGLMEFQSPLQKHVYEYDGEMVHSSNRRIDFGVTPDHRMLVCKWDERVRTLSSEYSFQRAGELGWYVGLPPSTTGFLGTELVELEVPGDRRYDGDDFLALLAIVASDGYAGGSENTRNWVSFCCFHPNRYGQAAALAARVGFREVPSRRGVWIRYDAGALANWIRANLYVGGGLGAVNKRCPDIVKVASERQIKHFLRFFGDQSHNEERGKVFYSTSKRMIDDLQELHLKIGKRGTIVAAEPHEKIINDNGVPSQCKKSYRLLVASAGRLCLDRKDHIHQDRYKGLVYCATVPNGTLITRRNDSILVSGNCWANGPAHAITTVRVIQGLPYEEMSACSVAVPISGGHQGGWEGDALKYGAQHGFVRSSLWGNNDTSRALMRNADCQADRENNKNVEWIDLGNRFENYATAALNTWPGAVAYNDWSHVVSVCDLVLLDDGHFALRIRNNWGKWGAANRFGQYGYAVFREGARTHGCPDSGFGLRVVTSSIK